MGIRDRAALGWTNPVTGETFVFWDEAYGVAPRIEELIHYHTLNRLGLLKMTEAEIGQLTIGGMDGITFLEREAANIMRDIGLVMR